MVQTDLEHMVINTGLELSINSVIVHCARYMRITELKKTCSHSTENIMNDIYNWNKYYNFGEVQTVSSL